MKALIVLECLGMVIKADTAGAGYIKDTKMVHIARRCSGLPVISKLAGIC
jgi:hypothetical protein